MIKLAEVKTKAKTLGISNPSSNKTELIKQIQRAEGFTACYKAKSNCDQMACCWREECVK